MTAKPAKKTDEAPQQPADQLVITFEVPAKKQPAPEPKKASAVA